MASLPRLVRQSLPRLAFLLVCGWPAAASAVIVLEKGKSEPTIGRLVRMEERVVVIQQQAADGQWRTREIFRADIEDLVVSVSEERLGRLTPDQPSAYRDYAEELAIKRKDPDALVVSLRLFLIAAWLDPQKLGRSSLLGMVALARDRGEERRFRAMAFMLDPRHDRSVLTAAAQPARKVDQAGLEGMLKAIQALRRGQRRAAQQVAARPAVKQAWDSFAEVLTYDEFLGLAPETLSASQLARLLTLELLLSQQEDASAAAAGRGASTAWAEAVARKETDPVRELTLETLTEFDPRECVYRDGRWLRPAAAP